MPLNVSPPRISNASRAAVGVMAAGAAMNRGIQSAQAAKDRVAGAVDQARSAVSSRADNVGKALHGAAVAAQMPAAPPRLVNAVAAASMLANGGQGLSRKDAAPQAAPPVFTMTVTPPAPPAASPTTPATTTQGQAVSSSTPSAAEAELGEVASADGEPQPLEAAEGETPEADNPLGGEVLSDGETAPAAVTSSPEGAAQPQATQAVGSAAGSSAAPTKRRELLDEIVSEAQDMGLY